MKKIITAFLAVLLLFSSFSLCVCAEDNSIEGMMFNENTICTVSKPFETAPHTLETWIKLPKTYSERGGVILGNYGSARACLNFEIAKNGQPRIYYVYADKTVHNFYFDCDVRTGDWAHLAFVHDMDKKEIRVYLNGVLADTATGIVDYDPDAAKYAVGIGGDNRGGNEQYFKGAIRTITAYADVRTEKEIRAGMTAPNLNDYDLIAHYDLSSVSGNIIKDGSENGYDTVYTKTWFTDKEPVTDYAYSFCVVGDTQIVALNHPDEFHHIYDWIIANKDSKKIAHVFGLGDITDKSTDAEWALAKREINKLNGIVPYSLVRGNHDKSEHYNDTFATDEYKKNFEGFYETDKIENSYKRFTVCDTDYLLFTLDFGPSDDVMNWASSIIERYSDHKVIITTHCYLYRDGTTLDKNDIAPPNSSGSNNGARNNGDQMWDKFISKHENIFLVLSGHDPCSNIIVTQTKGEKGNTVTQMLIDPQGVDSSIGATGMVAMLYFSNDGKTITVENYSTVREQFFMSTSQFTVDISDWAEESDDNKVDGSENSEENLGGDNNGSPIPIVIGVGLVVIIGVAVVFILIKKRK